MAICVMKDTVDRLRSDAVAAQVNATDEQRADLDGLIDACDDALLYVTRPAGYSAGRLETSRTFPPQKRAAAIRAKHPGLLP
jgi:hypothetical protein